MSNYLIREGVFTHTRNPMYLGMSILILGLSIFSTNVFALLLPVIFVLLVDHIFISREEKLLTEAFGEEYSSYKKSVKRWI